MSPSLNNKRILVTRPGHQANRLCELISDKDGENILFPTIEIRPIIKSETLSTQFNSIEAYNIVIFVSRNAVKSAFDHYLDKDNIPEEIQFIAIGLATADALTRYNTRNIIHAGTQADSETLLQLAEMQQEQVRGKNILIIRGVGGRELLADTLKARGANVDYAEVYERCLPEYDINDVQKMWHDNKPEAIIVSSNEGLNNLMELTPVTDREQMFNTPLVVMSARTVELAKTLGFRSGVGIALDKSDEGLVTALLSLVGE